MKVGYFFFRDFTSLSDIGAPAVLTWTSIYWFSTAGPTASTRIYYERVNEKTKVAIPTIPHGVSFFPKELINVPRL